MTDDWRLTDQEEYLSGVTLVHKPYRAKSETSEHEHCAFCWAKFMDPKFSPEHRKFIEEHPDVLTEGWTTTAEHEDGAENHWICDRCFEDFRKRFSWTVASET